MSISENLIANESIVIEAKKHWIAPARDSLWAAGMILLGLILWYWNPSGDGILGFLWAAIAIARWVLLIGGIAWVVYNIIVWRTAEFAVTNLRVLRYEGFMQRRSSETLLTSVSDVKLNVGIVGKSLGYGDLQIFTQSGDAGADNFSSITKPAEFRNAMMTVKLQDQVASRPAPAPAPAAPAPVPAAPAPVAAVPAPAAATAQDQAASLVRLAELRDQGVITPEEFEAKKTEILSRM
jgi:hypothetical protein